MAQNDCTSITPHWPELQEQTLCERYAQVTPVLLGDGVNPILASQIAGGNLTGTGNTVYDVKTDLIVDAPLVISTCVLKMQPGKKIFIQTGQTLTIFSTKIYCCTAMWKGIELGWSSGVEISGNSIIEDAEYALKAFSWSAINVSYTRFNRNFVGIGLNVPSASATNLSMVFMTLGDGVSFECASPLNSGYSGQSPQPTQYSAAGIFMNASYQTDFTTGTQGACLFKDQLNGIVALGSYVGIDNCKFDNIILKGNTASTNNFSINTSVSDITGGNGVYTEGGVLVQSGFGKTSTASFNDCQNYAFNCQNTYAIINNNNITNLHFEGIRIRNTNTYVNSSRITDNSLSGQKTACSAMILIDNIGCDGGSHVVKDNTIAINSNNNETEKGQGIVIAGSLLHNVTVLAEHNTITCGLAQTAITLDVDFNNSTNNVFEIYNNDITTQVGTLIGINVVAKGNTTNIVSVNSNNITGTTAYAGRGIWVSTSENVDVCSNILDKFNIIIQNQSNLNSRFYRNEIGEAQSGTGLYFFPIGMPKSSSHYGNKWLATASSYGSTSIGGAARFFGSATNALLYKFYVNTNTTTGGSTFFMPPSVNVPNWFEDQDGQVSLQCQRQLNGFFGAEWEELLANGSLNATNTSKYDLWTGNQYLYAALRFNPTYLNSSSTLQSYYSNTLTTDIGKLQAVNEQLVNAMTSVVTNVNTLNANYAIIIASLTTPLPSTPANNILINDNLSRINANTAMLASRKVSVNANLGAVVAQINAISSVDNYTLNAKSVNLALIDYVQNTGVMSGTNLSTVTAIANQTIEGGGSYTILAKLLLSGCERKKAFDQLGVENRSYNKEMQAGADWTLFPNPSSDMITIQNLAAETNDQYDYTIINSVGTAIASGSFTDGQKAISLQNIPSGIYWLQLKNSTTDQLSVKKFVKTN